MTILTSLLLKESVEKGGPGSGVKGHVTDRAEVLAHLKAGKRMTREGGVTHIKDGQKATHTVDHKMVQGMLRAGQLTAQRFTSQGDNTYEYKLKK